MHLVCEETDPDTYQPKASRTKLRQHAPAAQLPLKRSFAVGEAQETVLPGSDAQQVSNTPTSSRRVQALCKPEEWSNIVGQSLWYRQMPLKTLRLDRPGRRASLYLLQVCSLFSSSLLVSSDALIAHADSSSNSPTTRITSVLPLAHPPRETQDEAEPARRDIRCGG